MNESEEIKKLCEETSVLVKSLRKTTDDQIAAALAAGGVSEFKGVCEKINNRLDKIEERKAALEAQLTDMAREKLILKDDNGRPLPEDHKEAHEAFRNFCRTGDNKGGSEYSQDRREFRFASKDKDGKERKSMSVIVDSDGGFGVLADVGGPIAKKVWETSPIMQVCRVQSISSDALEGPRDFDEADCGWVGETEARPETNTPALGEYRIPAHEMYAAPRVTQKLLDDANFNPEQFLIDKVSDKMRRTANTAFVSGNGVKKPRGFLDYASGTTIGSTVARVNTGHATLLTSDGIIALQDYLKEPYRSNAKWAMNRSSRRQVRQLKDSYGQYMWEPSLAAGQPQRLLGSDLLEFSDMPDVGASALPIAFADWMEFYIVVTRIGMRTLRDPYTAKPYIILYCTQRLGGDVLNTEAGAFQLVSA